MLSIPACAAIALCIASAMLAAGITGHIVISKPTTHTD